MSDAAVLVDSISLGASQRLLKHSQVHIHTVALVLVAFLQTIRDAVFALLAAVSASVLAAKLSAKHSVVLFQQHDAAVVPARSPTSLGLLSCTSTTVADSKARQLQQPRPTIATVATVHSVPINRSGSRTQPLLIPPQLPHHKGRLTVFLDLDETLLCTYRLQADKDSMRLVPSSTPNSSSSSSTTRRMSFSSLFNSSSGRRLSSSGGGGGGYRVTTCKPSEGQLALLGTEYSASCWMTLTPVNDTGAATTIAVFERPGCRQFLLELSKFAECILFTAASAAYAQPLADLLDPDHKLFTARLYSNSCCCVGGREGIKDLSGSGRDLSRVVLVDNSPYSFLLQPSNGLPCMPFHGHSADKQLLGVILPLLQSLSQLHDIRPLLSSKFRVREWLTSKGCVLPNEQY